MVIARTPRRLVALLRGINVGGAKRVAMADVRRVVEELGYGDAQTLLNSGNVVFTAGKADADKAAARIERAIATDLGVTARVTVLSAKEVGEAVRDHPLASIADDPSRLLVMVPADSKALQRLKPLLEELWTPEALALGKRVAYLWCATGVIDSQLCKAVARILGNDGTARNLATMTKILAAVESA